jgi:4-diphosphocytidyl-2-C-methyl-D-erythritol kinase
MLAFANAKINLGLSVTERRPDGYHNIETVFYPVKVHDAVEITNSDNTSCVVSGVSIPGDAADNICMRAFNALKEAFDLPPQQITLLKNIPVGAGLGGGSSDAAFLVKLVNQKFKLGLSDGELEDILRPLGADCPFFIRNKPVFANGKGDQFEALDLDLSQYYLVLVKPEAHVATVDAYRGITPSKSGASLKNLIHLPLKDWQQHIFNDFELPVFQKFPEVAAVKNALYHEGAIFAAMSGSGSSVFGIFESPVKLPGLETENRVFYNV